MITIQFLSTLGIVSEVFVFVAHRMTCNPRQAKVTSTKLLLGVLLMPTVLEKKSLPTSGSAVAGARPLAGLELDDMQEQAERLEDHLLL